MTANQAMDNYPDPTPAPVRAKLHDVPTYWELLRDYWEEANHEGGNSIPDTWDAFVRDFRIYVRVVTPLEAESILSKDPRRARTTATDTDTDLILRYEAPQDEWRPNLTGIHDHCTQEHCRVPGFNPEYHTGRAPDLR